MDGGNYAGIPAACFAHDRGDGVGGDDNDDDKDDNKDDYSINVKIFFYYVSECFDMSWSIG